MQNKIASCSLKQPHFKWQVSQTSFLSLSFPASGQPWERKAGQGRKGRGILLSSCSDQLPLFVVSWLSKHTLPTQISYHPSSHLLIKLYLLKLKNEWKYNTEELHWAGGTIASGNKFPGKYLFHICDYKIIIKKKKKKKNSSLL